MDTSMDEDFLGIVTPPKFSPDAFMLQNQDAHLVFDVGPTLKHVEVLCSAWTVERMTLLHHSHGVLPIKMDGLPRARVGGTLYAMTGDQVERLDIKRQNGVYFERQKIDVLFESKQTNPVCEYLPSMIRVTHQVPAKVFMWMGRPDYWGDQFEEDANNIRRGLDPKFTLAETFPDYELRELHNSYRYSGVRVEDQFLPEPREIGSLPSGYIRRKNEREISRITSVTTKVLQPVNFLVKATRKAFTFPTRRAPTLVTPPRMIITKDKGKDGHTWYQFPDK